MANTAGTGELVSTLSNTGHRIDELINGGTTTSRDGRFRGKAVQALVSFAILSLVIARAVNVL
jgi:hypothetical protein